MAPPPKKGARSDDPGLAPRALALDMIEGVQDERMTMAEMLVHDHVLSHPPAVRARAQRLALATLRQMARADAALKPFMQRRPHAEIRALLRLAVTEILGEGAAPHGVVNTAVALAKSRRPSASGMVNAVLRKVADDAGRAAWDAAQPQRLPNWLRGRVGADWGNAAVARMEAAHERGAPLDITPKFPRKAETLAEELGGRLLPTGSIRLDAPGQVSALPGFDDGAWWVQDAAAALPARLTGAAPGKRVLDLCAAPGGKTMQLAATGADVTALDISEGRLERLRDNLARTGMENVELVTADVLDWTPDAPFDAILLDAPCTATGTIRRHPDLPQAKDGTEIKPLVTLQAEMLDRALGWLAPDGVLVFCTCSILKAEGEAQLAAALERHPDLSVRPLPAGLAQALPEGWAQESGAIRTRPDHWSDLGSIDGFFMVALQRG
ncbi:MAG: transcription antitermination factor NusB [Celeribacter sp.]|jgi:16S rRNA (cytosine967-C5)-methyltransferase